jgi:hypothetical protein
VYTAFGATPTFAAIPRTEAAFGRHACPLHAGTAQRTITVVSGDKVRPYQPITGLERVVYGVTLLVNSVTRQIVFAGFLAVTIVSVAPESSAWFAIGVAATVVAVNQSLLSWPAIPMAAIGGAVSMYLFLATRKSCSASPCS